MHLDPPDPVEAIVFRMEQQGLIQADLARLPGSRSRPSELLNRKRPINIAHAYRLHNAWNIPAELLIRPYHAPA